MYADRMPGDQAGRRWKAAINARSVTPMNVANHCQDPCARANVRTAANPMPMTPT